MQAFVYIQCRPVCHQSHLQRKTRNTCPKLKRQHRDNLLALKVFEDLYQDFKLFLQSKDTEVDSVTSDSVDQLTVLTRWLKLSTKSN
ncbi:hypothetical protein KUTeg_006633 [Tegillarca granosa]|uniref:Uncharacterized protein n=1 Tax=Tegillarca granosa TaxID=220873 RepID=A0ABQ9FAV7_TEGGR|nr:hypothetical protein KUTeg_006633 [Tegillarca granosa]